MLLLIFCIVLVMGISFLCSLTEACFLSLAATDLAALAEKKPRRADVMRQLKNNVEKPIAAILIVNNLVNIFGAALAGAIFVDVFGQKWIGVFSFLLALAIIQWSEYLPKTLGVIYKRQLAGLVTMPLARITRLLAPLIFVLDRVNLPFRGRKRSQETADTLADIVLLTRAASLNKLISSEQEDIVSRSIMLSGAKVGDIMVARDEINYLSVGMTMMDALIEAHIHHHTRYLLIDGKDLDKILGFVNVKDIVSALQINPKDPSLKGIARPVLEVKESQSVPLLLQTLTKGYQHMAIVKNDAGRTVGLVTLEDVVEAIVGNLEDEYDLLPDYVYRIAEGRFLVGGGITLKAMKEKTGLAVPADPVCLNDWLAGLIPAAPVIEQRIPYRDLVFTIRKMRRSKIHEIIVDKNVPANLPPHAAEQTKA
jgi:CBS domain containing-hemolysin-like protein